MAVARMRLIIPVLALMLVLLQYQLWSPSNGLPNAFKLQAAVEERRAENARLEERNLALEADVKDLKEGLDALEERARSELGMIRKDEVFYQVAD